MYLNLLIKRNYVNTCYKLYIVHIDYSTCTLWKCRLKKQLHVFKQNKINKKLQLLYVLKNVQYIAVHNNNYVP